MAAPETIRDPRKHWAESRFALTGRTQNIGAESGTLKWDTAPGRYLADGERLAGRCGAGLVLFAVICSAVQIPGSEDGVGNHE